MNEAAIKIAALSVMASIAIPLMALTGRSLRHRMKHRRAVRRSLAQMAQR